MKANQIKIAAVVAVVLVLLIFGSRFYISVEAGHVAVATLFGKVQDDVYEEGLHIVNPLYNWVKYDARQKTHLEKAKVPSQDQLTTNLDVSVQFRIIKESAPSILKNTGNYRDILVVHLIPKLRSLLREQGKGVVRAEDFFKEETQSNLQTNLLAGMKEFMEPKGIEVSAVLLRDITLPDFITRAIEKKKEREQEVEKQKAELERYKTEQQQKIELAKAEQAAAAAEAKKIKLLADAQAYEIEKINRAIAKNPAYIKLQSLEALKAISKDKTSKIYFINGDSPNPLPLMNIGDK